MSKPRLTADEYANVFTNLKQILANKPLTPVIINDKSSFVVCTYWWGRGRLNANLQRPCITDIFQPSQNDLKEKLNDDLRDGKGPADVVEAFKKGEELFRVRNNLSKEELVEYENTKKIVDKYHNDYFKSPDGMKALAAERNNITEMHKSYTGAFHQGTTYEVMIDRWVDYCKKAKCNYLAQEYPEFVADYQMAINAKPLFIKKAVESCGGRGVLYIDGDMIMRQYPHIFDMKNVDYMGRGWCMDPRESTDQPELLFDPYAYETSGGTMFFAKTASALKLLDDWANESEKYEMYGKADDRILSMVVIQKNFALTGNMIQLPIEYLWLTDKYSKNVDWYKAGKFGTVKTCIIEHPECLTAEETAAEQGAASEREPDNYEEVVHDPKLTLSTTGGTFYEYIFFPTKDMVNAFKYYLSFLECEQTADKQKYMYDIVPYEDFYGHNNSIAFQNDTNARKIKTSDGKLPINAPISDILAHLYKGIDVRLGDIEPLNDTEFTATNIAKNVDYHYKLELDVTKPMYISSSNIIIQHLLRMCNDLADINRHLKDSYLFLSRIRWGETNKSAPAPAPDPAPAPPPPPDDNEVEPPTDEEKKIAEIDANNPGAGTGLVPLNDMLKNDKPANTTPVVQHPTGTGPVEDDPTTDTNPQVTEISSGQTDADIGEKPKPGPGQNYMYNLLEAKRRQNAGRKTWRKKVKNMKRKNTRAKK